MNGRKLYPSLLCFVAFYHMVDVGGLNCQGILMKYSSDQLAILQQPPNAGNKAIHPRQTVSHILDMLGVLLFPKKNNFPAYSITSIQLVHPKTVVKKNDTNPSFMHYKLGDFSLHLPYILASTSMPPKGIRGNEFFSVLKTHQ